MDKTKKYNLRMIIILLILLIFLVLLVVFNILLLRDLRSTQDALREVKSQLVSDEIELNPCPMCGKDVELQPINDSFYIECEYGIGNDGCGLHTGYYDSKMELISLWNKESM